MWAYLTFVDPAVSLPAFLIPGSLRESLTTAVAILIERKLIPKKALLAITNVALTETENSDYKVGDCNPDTMVVGKSLLEISKFTITCTWAPENVAAEEATAIRQELENFSKTTLKDRKVLCPMLTDLAVKTLAKPEQPTTPPVVPVLPPPKIRVYFSSAVSEGYYAGDASYIMSLVQALNAINVDATRLVGDALKNWVPAEYNPMTQGADPDLKLLYYKKRANWRHDEDVRAAALRMTWDHLMQEKTKHPRDKLILHIQSRNMDSGGAFTKDFIDQIKGEGFHVVTTVHEILFNLRKAGVPQNNDLVLSEHCSTPDAVVFLNDDDMYAAIDIAENGGYGYDRRNGNWGYSAAAFNSPNKNHNFFYNVDCDRLRGRAHHIPLIVTVPPLDIQENQILARPCNIALFGMIRRGKGSEGAYALARKIKQQGKAWRVFIIGNPTDEDERVALFRNVYGNTLLEAVKRDWYIDAKSPKIEIVRGLQTDCNNAVRSRAAGHGNVLPIDLHLAPKDSELAAIFRQCKYACKDDEKGMADNASSIVSCIANGCITLTWIGDLTPHAFKRGTQETSFDKSTRLAMPQARVSFGETQVEAGGQLKIGYVGEYTEAIVPLNDLSGDAMYAEILRRQNQAQEADNKRTIAAMRRVMTERFTPRIIAEEHRRLYESL
jgi:hypothetical protein